MLRGGVEKFSGTSDDVAEHRFREPPGLGVIATAVIGIKQRQTAQCMLRAMREAMARAEVGDDVFGDDPTVIRLEALAAERLGKAAAVYVPSGTMANLAALLAHCGRGDEVILGNVISAGLGLNAARVAAMASGVPQAQGGGAKGPGGTAELSFPKDKKGAELRLDPATLAREARMPSGTTPLMRAGKRAQMLDPSAVKLSRMSMEPNPRPEITPYWSPTGSPTRVLLLPPLTIQMATIPTAMPTSTRPPGMSP